LGERVDTNGYIDLQTIFGRGSATKAIKIKYLMVDACTLYSFVGKILIEAIVSTPHLAMKFPTDKGEISTIYVDQRVA